MNIYIHNDKHACRYTHTYPFMYVYKHGHACTYAHHTHTYSLFSRVSVPVMQTGSYKLGFGAHK